MFNIALRWKDFDPRNHAFSKELLRQAVEESNRLSLEPRHPQLTPQKRRALFYKQILELFSAKFGQWAQYLYLRDDFNQFVESVRLTPHKPLAISEKPNRSQQELELVVDELFTALSQWRESFVQLAELLSDLQTSTSLLSETEKLNAVTKAIPDIVNFAVEITDANEAWYFFVCDLSALALTMCSIPYDSSTIEGLATASFSSHCAPDSEATNEYCVALATEITKLLTTK